jgi:hypothetical protein
MCKLLNCLKALTDSKRTELLKDGIVSAANKVEQGVVSNTDDLIDQSKLKVYVEARMQGEDKVELRELYAKILARLVVFS